MGRYIQGFRGGSYGIGLLAVEKQAFRRRVSALMREQK